MKLAKPLLNNNVLKIISLFFGYTFWVILSQSHLIQYSCNIPLCFYNSQNNIIMAPESINITLQGKRSNLFTLDFETLAVHINAQKLHTGKNILFIDTKELFLPSTISMVNCKPSNVIITMEKNKNK